MLNPILSAPAPRRQKPRQGPREAHGPPPFPQHQHRRKTRSGGARRALRLMNSPAATMSAAPVRDAFQRRRCLFRSITFTSGRRSRYRGSCNGPVLHAATPRSRASAMRCRAGRYSPGDASSAIVGTRAMRTTGGCRLTSSILKGAYRSGHVAGGASAQPAEARRLAVREGLNKGLRADACQ
jgi:hypothetical protein